MVFEFDRYINGQLMAEGVTIERQGNLPDAMREAARIASRGPNGEVPVLVLRAEALSRTGAVKVDRQRLNAEISKWATDSDLHITIGDVEALHEAILSALEPAAPEGSQTCATEGCDNPATNEFIRGGVGSFYCGDCFVKVIEACETTRPAEQAVTEAARSVLEWYERDGSVGGAVEPFEALKAAMEAGR